MILYLSYSNDTNDSGCNLAEFEGKDIFDCLAKLHIKLLSIGIKDVHQVNVAEDVRGYDDWIGPSETVRRDEKGNPYRAKERY